MRIFQTFSSASVKAGTQAAAVAVPGLGGAVECRRHHCTMRYRSPKQVHPILIAAKSVGNTFTDTLLANSLLARSFGAIRADAISWEDRSLPGLVVVTGLNTYFH